MRSKTKLIRAANENKSLWKRSAVYQQQKETFPNCPQANDFIEKRRKTRTRKPFRDFS
jgi:hypothetical protein